MPADLADAHAWYALRTRSRHKKVVRDQLATRGIEPFLPLVTRWRRWQDRHTQVAFPLFPGYCFARFPLHQRIAVLSAIGVVQILGDGRAPSPSPRGRSRASAAFTSTLPVDPHPRLREGDWTRGPLAGFEGILLRKGSRARLVLSVRLSSEPCRSSSMRTR